MSESAWQGVFVVQISVNVTKNSPWPKLRGRKGGPVTKSRGTAEGRRSAWLVLSEKKRWKR